MKKLYAFQIPITKLIDKQVQKEIDGKPVTVLEKTEEITNESYFIKRPTRPDYDDAQFIYDKKFSQDVREGILTYSEVIKRFSNDDVAIQRVYKDYAAKENEYQRLSLLDKTPENIEKKNNLEKELLGYLAEMQDFEMSKSSVFEHTAESRARNKTLLWWILNLAYKEDKETPIFDGPTYDEKAASYDKIIDSEDEKDKHIQEVISRFLYLIAFWYRRHLSGQNTKDEDFKKAEDLLKAEINKQKIEPETKKDETVIVSPVEEKPIA